MLVELRVENLGVISDLDLVLPSGMTVITGETGAGKTLIVEAIELLVGGRADPMVVRAGANEARIDGRFVAGDDEIVLTRVVPAEGRSRAYIDGRIAPISALAEHGRALVDLHGQHSHQSLLASSVQRGALDRFAGAPVERALEGYRAARARARDAAAALRDLGGDARSRAREIDLLRYERREIDAAAIVDVGEVDRLAAEEDLLADAAAHREAAELARAALNDGALDAVGAALANIADRAAFGDVEPRMRAVQAEIAEVARDIRVIGEGIVDDPAQLEAVRARRQLLRSLCRKYGDTLAEVIAAGAERATRLGALEGYEVRAASLETDRDDAETEARRHATALTDARRAAAAPLAAAITGHFDELALTKAWFDIVVDDDTPSDDGADAVTFVFGANPGEPVLPLAKIASGGELARVMLAARVVLSGAPPTLVFDEVDAGIGGEAGVAVGRKLGAIAADHQVLVVTHLPQIAAFADAQVVVTKQERGGRTTASATAVAGDARVAEISRMLAGAGGSSHARHHAQELLVAAARERTR